MRRWFKSFQSHFGARCELRGSVESRPAEVLVSRHLCLAVATNIDGLRAFSGTAQKRTIGSQSGVRRHLKADEP